MRCDLIYDGQRLTWGERGAFRATSGLPRFQVPEEQCRESEGPTPEGIYTVGPLILAGEAPARRRDCAVVSGRGLQTIPRGAAAGPECEVLWAHWGRHRIRFEAANAATRNRCSTRRDGFYLHDSVKGYTHGCIEVESRFFSALKLFIDDMRGRRIPRREALVLGVEYRRAIGRRTNGGTAESPPETPSQTPGEAR